MENRLAGNGARTGWKELWKKYVYVYVVALFNYPRQEFSNTQQQKMQNVEDFGLAVKPRKSWQDTQSNCFVNENRKKKKRSTTDSGSLKKLLE